MRRRTSTWQRTVNGARVLAAWPPARLVLAIVLLVAVGLVLPGCSTVPPQIQTVKVAVPVECREPVPDRPAMPTEGLAAGADLDASVAALLAEIELREGYEVRLRTALDACTRPLAGPVSLP